MTRHVHLGLGRLGLGFVAPRFSSKGAPFLGLIRHGSAAKHYTALEAGIPLRLDYGDGNHGSCPAPAIERYTSDDPLKALAARLGPAAPQIISSSVGDEGLPHVFDVICRALTHYRDAYREQPLIYIPFENRTDAGTTALEFARAQGMEYSELRQIFRPFDCVVDKICASITISEGDDRVCRIDTERYERCILTPVTEDQLPAALRHVLDTIGLLEWVRGRKEFEFEIRKKFWVLNNLQYALGLLALNAQMPPDTTLVAAMKNSRIAEWLERLQHELAIALFEYAREQHHDVAGADLEDHIRTATMRIASRPDDDVRRVLKGLCALLDALLPNLAARCSTPGVVGFAEKWRARVLEPTDILLDHPWLFTAPLRLPRLSHLLLQQLETVVERIAQYPPTEKMVDAQ